MRRLFAGRYPALTLGHAAVPLLAVFSTWWLSSAQALGLGLAVAVTVGNPFLVRIKNITHRLLAVSIVGLGFGMDLVAIGHTGLHGLQYTVLGLAFTFALGTLLGLLFKTPKNTSLLLTVGTGICGGSAIAATAPVIGARHEEVVVALGTVFMLNAVALLTFPSLGHFFHLTEGQFGLWCALSIHDTSSVVGATMQYGPFALAVGATIKLARALWIVPVALLIGVVRQRTESATSPKSKFKVPWFIVGFVAAAALVTFVPPLQPVGAIIEIACRRLMVLTLFFIGSSLTPETIKQVGVRPFFQGVVLWATMSILTLTAILSGWLVIPFL